MTKSDLDHLPEYISWSSGSSSLLVLHGCNEPGNSIDDSWLSPAAVSAIHDLTERRSVVAHYMSTMTNGKPPIIPALICQLVEQKPLVLRDGADFQHMVTQLSKTKDDSDRDEGLREVLLRVVDRCPEPVHIVIDRPEQYESMGGLLTTLISVVKESMNTVRVFVVMRTEFYDVDRYHREVDTRGIKPGMYIKLRKDQQRQYN